MWQMQPKNSAPKKLESPQHILVQKKSVGRDGRMSRRHQNHPKSNIETCVADVSRFILAFLALVGPSFCEISVFSCVVKSNERKSNFSTSSAWLNRSKMTCNNFIVLHQINKL